MIKGHFLAIFAGIIASVGQILIKKGINSVPFDKFFINLIIEIIKNKFVIVGLVIVGISYLMWLISLKYGDLVTMWLLLIGSCAIMLFILSDLFLNEKVSFTHIIGGTIIILGIFIIMK